jgi:tellurite resistance protein TerC
MITNEMIFFGSFIGFVLLMLVIDLGVFSKKSHTVSFKEAGIWSAVWVVFALIFYAIIYQYGDLIHGITNFAELESVVQRFDPETAVKLDPNNFAESLADYRKNMALEFITGYLLEYSLSVDNIFVIILIFASFKVENQYYKKVLFWGILGAIVMRFVFIFVGATLIHHFNWILYIFGAFLLYVGLKMFFTKEEDEDIDPNNHTVVKLVSKYFSIYPKNADDKFFVRENGVLYLTPLFIVVLIIEFTDLLFAVDSVPAVFAVTEDQYIVFFSNIFAILGLRSMFFFLANIMHIFHYLKIGLSFLLVFIGGKMLAHHYLKEIGFKTEYSLFIILGILAVSIIASLLFPQKEETNA